VLQRSVLYYRVRSSALTLWCLCRSLACTTTLLLVPVSPRCFQKAALAPLSLAGTVWSLLHAFGWWCAQQCCRVVGTMCKVLLLVCGKQRPLLAFNQLSGPLVVLWWLCASIGCSCGVQLAVASLVLLAGKQWLSATCLKQDRAVLVM
jgi:hypothetical protein